MGLDNGIRVISKKKIPFLKDWFDEKNEKNEYGLYECDPIYHRKDWGLRNDIVHCLTVSNIEEYEYVLDKDKIKDLIKIFKSWDDPVKWDSEGHSIWYYEEDYVHKHLRHDIWVLRWLYLYLTLHPRFLAASENRIYFYDSY